MRTRTRANANARDARLRREDERAPAAHRAAMGRVSQKCSGRKRARSASSGKSMPTKVSVPCSAPCRTTRWMCTCSFGSCAHTVRGVLGVNGAHPRPYACVRASVARMGPAPGRATACARAHTHALKLAGRSKAQLPRAGRRDPPPARPGAVASLPWARSSWVASPAQWRKGGRAHRSARLHAPRTCLVPAGALGRTHYAAGVARAHTHTHTRAGATRRPLLVAAPRRRLARERSSAPETRGCDPPAQGAAFPPGACAFAAPSNSLSPGTANPLLVSSSFLPRNNLPSAPAAGAALNPLRPRGRGQR